MTGTKTTRLLGGRSSYDFLREYWQKKPLLIRQAFPAFQSPIAPEDLAGLACEDNVESRLVRQREPQSDYTLRHGPFEDADFTRLPAERWTLLVQDVEKHIPELAWIPERFAFIPSWRIDDLMVSYAAPHGTVGPHVDQYDVFLLQGQGRRRWQIDTDGARYRQRHDTELKLIEAFMPAQDWVLEPGDMLYLPPGVAHYGVALGACLTYSIGFRAPSHHDMLADFLGVLAEQAKPTARYCDPELEPSADPGRLDPAVLDKVASVLRGYLQPESHTIAAWFGCFITEPKPGLEDSPPRRRLTSTALVEAINAGASLHRSDKTRFVWCPTVNEAALLFIAGDKHTLGDQSFAALLCARRVLPPTLLDAYLEHDDILRLLTNLYNAGHIAFEDDQ